MRSFQLDFNRFFLVGLLLWLLLLLLGSLVDVMEVDAAQYAAMGREMYENGHYLEVYERGERYNSLGNPDKPPLLFWLSAWSTWLLGVSNFSYKLPSILVGLLGVYSLFALAKLIYDYRTARLAALIYGSSLGFILMLNDVRTDALLIGWVIFACWQLETYFRTRRWTAFLLAFSGIALAMLAKGPLGLIAVAAPFGMDALIRRDWKRIFRWEWLLGIVVILIWLLPMLIGLYRQWGWDQGVIYYFWTQSFGRITGENVWKDDTSPFFFTHTFLWSFLPWSLLVLAGLFNKLKDVGRQWRNALPGEFIGTTGLILLFLAMSASHFKLPHYIYCCFPFAALLVADYLADLQINSLSFRWWSRVHLFVALLIMAVFGLVVLWIFPAHWLWLLAGLLIVGLLFYLFFQRQEIQLQLLGPPTLALLAFGFLANGHFYPQLLRYQASSQAGKYIQQAAISKEAVALFAIGEESIHALDFYADMTVVAINETGDLLKDGQSKRWVYTNPAGLERLQAAGMHTRVVKTWPYFQVTHLQGRFLDPKKRQQTLEERYFVEVSR